jgi:CheY-like chemotaxis protein
MKSVLVIDDDSILRRLTAMSLRASGAWSQVLVAASGAEGIEIAAREAPSLILLDVMMPDMDGPATLRKLKESPATASIPVLFLTGKAEANEPSAYLDLGARGAISKPFDPAKLPDQIRHILGD